MWAAEVIELLGQGPFCLHPQPGDRAETQNPINTASWKGGGAWGLEILRRYRARGGEFVTVGSDAHAPARVGSRIPEAIELARAAGIPYLATFDKMRPVLHPL